MIVIDFEKVRALNRLLKTNKKGKDFFNTDYKTIINKFKKLK